jgi:hypothetical protein
MTTYITADGTYTVMNHSANERTLINTDTGRVYTIRIDLWRMGNVLHITRRINDIVDSEYTQLIARRPYGMNGMVRSEYEGATLAMEFAERRVMTIDRRNAYDSLMAV